MNYIIIFKCSYDSSVTLKRTGYCKLFNIQVKTLSGIVSIQIPYNNCISTNGFVSFQLDVVYL